MQREAEAGGIGLGSKAAAEHAALATRERKQYGLETHTWREEVRARAGELGLGAEELAELLRSGSERIMDGLATHEGVDERAFGDALAGAEGLTERANTFDERPVLQEFAIAARHGALVADVRAQAKRFGERTDIIPTASGEMTTAELVGCERDLIAAAIGRAGEQTAILDGELTERAIARADRPLNPEQAAAVRAVAGSGQGVSVIQALAGTGKTYIAGVLAEAYASAGYEVLGVAPTGRGVRELTEEAGIPARTLDRLLLDLQELGEELPQRSVIVLDEAGMAATRRSARLLKAAEQAGAKAIAIGDPGQLASVQAGGWLGAVGRALGALRLTEVMRQRDPAERRALGALHERHPRAYLEWADQTGRIQTFASPDEVSAAAIEEWTRASANVGPAQAVMIARDNETREELNQAARAVRHDLGALGEDHAYGELRLAVGDRVICRHNDRALDVDNGMRGTVRHQDPNRLVIDTDSGLVRELTASYAAEHLEHAYALTGHGMQGGTVETATVIASPRDLTAGWSYTALSRARGHTRLFIHEDEHEHKRSEFAPTDNTAQADRNDLLARVARRMLERDDEDLAIEQLPGAGRTDDPAIATAATGGPQPDQEQAAALPDRPLQRIDDLDARAHTLSTQREQLTERLDELPAPTRRLGREHDPHAPERAHLTSALRAGERELDSVLRERGRLTHELGDPAEIRAERDGLQRSLAQLTQEQTEVRDELAEHEVRAPGAWAQQTLGELPDSPHLRKTWEQAVRHAARYRISYGIIDPDTVLGPEPTQPSQKRDWKRARQAIESGKQRLCGEANVKHEPHMSIGLS